MKNHEITFNTHLSEPPRTQADFTYNITPAMISITDTGLDKCSVTEDIEAVLRKIRNLLAAFSGVATQNRRGNFRDNAAPDKSRLKIGRYNRQTSMYEALVETLEMV